LNFQSLNLIIFPCQKRPDGLLALIELYLLLFLLFLSVSDLYELVDAVLLLLGLCLVESLVLF
jgi:hypothetical protein